MTTFYNSSDCFYIHQHIAFFPFFLSSDNKKEYKKEYPHTIITIYVSSITQYLTKSAIFIFFFSEKKVRLHHIGGDGSTSPPHTFQVTT